MTKYELIEKYLKELCDRADDFYKHEFENVLTRFTTELELVDVEKVWKLLPITGGYEPGSSLNCCKMITSSDLRAALEAAGRE